MASNTIIQHNIPAMNVYRNMDKTGKLQGKSSEKLSSGYRINRAADDAAGLAISEKMRGQIRGLDQSSKNVSDAISLIATAEGGMQGIDDMLHRIRELVDYAANDTQENNNTGTGDRQKIQDEIDQLVEEIDSMSERVEFNKKKLINGSFQDTKAQLANAQATYDKLDVEKTGAAASVTALQTGLKAAQTDLKTAQDALSSAGASSDATRVYTAAVKAYKTAEMDYNTKLNEYNDAKVALRDALTAAGLSDLENLTTAHFDTKNADGVYVGTQKASDLKAALERYDTAAKDIGVDELGISLTTASAVVSHANVMNSSPKSTTTTTNTKFGDITSGLKGEELLWDTAKTTFADAELDYQKAVSERDVAQAKVDNINAMITEATRNQTAIATRFNAAAVSLTAAKDLDDKNASRALHFQVGANANQSLIMSIGSLKSDTLGIGNGNGKSYINVVKDTGQDITATIDVLDQALSYVTTERSRLGAAQNRMEYTQDSLNITSENLSDAESRIRDTDMAKEMMNYTKANILQQAAVSMMAQANQTPQNVLQLLR